MRCIPYRSRIKKYLDGEYWWYNKYGLRQSFNDQPALRAISYDFFKWYQNGLLHREHDKPAYIGYRINGTSMWWYIKGQLMKRQYPDNSFEYFD